ncbi:unnamed protein product [Adineta steineri]|uniref:Uncharacterized protein n=1 Tax=Adineta steineri TaxID=433720 RepID=A0A813TN26_9BILA|nr:unnamed protein product [Adineta steineri]CAF0832815.1 unnamed protein product [Adineta steineri]CAF4143973.1 unnamed protein product [Adineta steineri]
MKLILLVLTIVKFAWSSSSSYKIISATAWITTPISLYPDFSASLTPIDFQPSIFQYSFNGPSTVFTCTTRSCKQVSMVPMPGLNVARLAYGGVSPRRIQQLSPVVVGTQFFLSTGYATPNRDTELIACAAEDPACSKPNVMNTVNSPGFGQAGLRLTFTRPLGLPIMLIPEARYASRDNRVTGYTIEACQDPLCHFSRSRSSLPFNLTGNANCLGTSIDVALNQLGFPSWLTLCGTELNLIHCLSATCNETLVNQFKVNHDFVYFTYLAVDSQFRFTIATTGQTAQSDITYIRCLDPDCTQSIQSQLTIANRTSLTRTSIARVQVVIDTLTDLPVFHLTGSIYPSNVPIYMFVACQDIDCDMSKAVYIDYGAHFDLNRVQVSDVFVDDEGTVIASIRAVYTSTNDTINAIVRMAQSSEAEVDRFTFVEPISIN